MNAPALGAIQSPADYRDKYVAAALAGEAVPAELPAAYETPIKGSVLDQKKTPSCVSHAWALAMRTWWFTRTGELVDFSPRFLDVLAKRYDGQDRATGGTFPRLVAKLGTQFGCATTKTVTNDTTLPILQYRDDSVVTKEALDEAVKYRTPGYVRIGTDKGSLRLASYLYRNVSLLVNIGSEWWTPSWDASNTDPVRPPAAVVSGHEVVLRGWKDDVYDAFTNSWSSKWGSLGSSRINDGLWRPWMVEAWAIAQVPQDVADFLRALPSPTEFRYYFSKDVHYGDEGEEVKFVQVALMILGYLAPVPADQLGHYGPKTSNAVFNFQVSHGIYHPSANDVGKATRAQLNAIFWT